MQGIAAPYEWDKDGKLQNCVAFSRLLVPTSVSFRYAARIGYNTDHSIADISPANIRGVPVDTFLSTIPPERDWLTEAAGMRLQTLLARIDSKPLPPRATRAFWYHEYAVRTYYVELCRASGAGLTGKKSSCREPARRGGAWGTLGEEGHDVSCPYTRRKRGRKKNIPEGAPLQCRRHKCKR